jgi:hypothetical protein
MRIPKHRKNILGKEVSEYSKIIFNKIAEEYDFQDRYDGTYGRPRSHICESATEILSATVCTD